MIQHGSEGSRHGWQRVVTDTHNGELDLGGDKYFYGAITNISASTTCTFYWVNKIQMIVINRAGPECDTWYFANSFKWESLTRLPLKYFFRKRGHSYVCQWTYILPLYIPQCVLNVRKNILRNGFSSCIYALGNWDGWEVHRGDVGINKRRAEEGT